MSRRYRRRRNPDWGRFAKAVAGGVTGSLAVTVANDVLTTSGGALGVNPSLPSTVTPTLVRAGLLGAGILAAIWLPSFGAGACGTAAALLAQQLIPGFPASPTITPTSSTTNSSTNTQTQGLAAIHAIPIVGRPEYLAAIHAIRPDMGAVRQAEAMGYGRR